MSIFFEFDVGKTGRRFRKAVDADKYDIELFWNREHTVELFGAVDLARLIELSVLSICMINEKKEVVGFMALEDHPKMSGLDPANWEIWIRNMFQRYYLSRNTLFIHFMCYNESASDYFLEEALISVFMNDFYLLHIVVVVPPHCTHDPIQTFKKRNIHKYFAKSEDDEKMFHFIYTALRQDFCPKLKMRRAVEEDNDDIVEILDTKCPRLKDMYGAYYISEIIGQHPESQRRVIVAEHQDRAIGVMCLNSDIDYKNLQKMYELNAYCGLMKATPYDKELNKRNNTLLNVFGNPIMLGQWSPFDCIEKIEHLHTDQTPSKETLKDVKRTKLSKVNFRQNAAMRQSFDHIMSRQQNSDDYSDKIFANSPSTSLTVDRSAVNLILDDDPFDYEIVNIDKNLLTIPEVLSTNNVFKQTESTIEMKPKANLSRLKRRNSVFNTQGTNKTEGSDEIIYHGGPNAFMIELYGLREDIDDRCAFDLLEAAFEIMKDYDYCIIRLPSDDRSFPLLQHFCFVPEKPSIASRYSLFVAHRSSVLGKLRVREAEFIDIPEIASLLSNLNGKETLWTIENHIANKRQHLAYVFMSGLSIVGIGILEQPEQIDFIRTKFRINPYHKHKCHCKGNGINAGFAAVKVVLAYSVFDVHFRFFARDVMRLSGSSALIWLTAYRNIWVAHKANSLASAMVPLMPRLSELDCTSIPELNKLNTLSKNIMAFSTWFINKKLTSVPKVNITTRIVIVGASETAMAFLNTLLFSDSSSYLNFTSVTLVSPNGLPYVRHSKPIAEMMFPRRRTATDKFMKSVPYTFYVNVVQGAMVEINEQRKYITLLTGSKCHYDLLFLLNGKQYQHPNYLEPLLERERNINLGKIPPYVRLDVPSRDNVQFQYIENNTPDNVFIINNIAEAHKCLKYVKNIARASKYYKIIVYGATIHAYCCIATLLEMKVPAANIVFIEPFPPEDPKTTRVPVFCNTNCVGNFRVDQTVREVLDNLNVTVHRSYYFESWTVGIDNLVSHVDFISQYHMLRLDCAAFFYYGRRGVDMQAYIAINKSRVAYDGGILIDHQFRTKNPYIYAAGPATAYFRKYADAYKYKQKHFDSYEIGEKLGAQIRNQLDPLFREERFTSNEKTVSFSSKSVSFNAPSSTISSSYSEDSSSLKLSSSSIMSSRYPSDKFEEELPQFTKPTVIHCTLPGGLQYLEVRAPGNKIPHHFVQSLQYNGIVMETFKSGYFKLHLNNELVVDGITCLSPKKYSLDNFKNIYGMSAVILNNVHLRYTAKKIDDFYEFFRSPWAFFLYHDQADELFAMVKELLPKGKYKGETLREALHSVGKQLSSPSFRYDTKLRIRTSFEKSPHVEAITDYVIDWLSDNDVLLPMYLQPSQTAEFTYDMRRNPVFKKKKRTVTKMMSTIF